MRQLRNSAWFVTSCLITIMLPLLIAIGVENGMSGHPFSGKYFLPVVLIAVVVGLAVMTARDSGEK